MKQPCAITVVLLMLPCLLWPQNFYADYVSLGSGYYSAFNGSSASPVDIGYFAINEETIIGAELQVKQISATVFNAENVRITSVMLSSYYGYHFKSDIVMPYVAGGLLIGFNGLNSDDVTRQQPDLIVKDNLAQSFGLIGLLGIHVIASNNISVFADYRFGIDYLYASIENQSDEFVNLGGHYLRAGIRITINSSEDL